MAGVGPETLRRLLDEHAAALVLYARQWCQTPEDIVQDVLLALVEEPVAPENPVGWLYRAVRNKALNAARAGRRRERHETAAARRGEPWLVASPGDRLDAAAAAAALAELPVEEREVLVARLWGALSFEEIAQLCGTSLSTAYRRYQQGIATLREKLEGICPAANQDPNKKTGSPA
jgi:RNA polymerase sigma-70 factor (ECF subfamily)